MPSPPPPPGAPAAAPVVVVGGGLAGMAAAARLAKAGHPVELYEAAASLGGSWAPSEVDGLLVDAAPAVLGFPAPWRDLFRKSGRPLEAELERRGLALAPATAARYRFADGTELMLPAERGAQHAALTRAYGTAVAVRWQELLDGLDRVWQRVRPLGLEAELRDRGQLDREVRRALRSRQTLAQLAAGLDEPHLEAVVRSVAYRLGSAPELTPAWCAVELSVARKFGRWTVTATDGGPDTGRSSVLVELLAARLALRRVPVHLGRRVTRVHAEAGRVTAVSTADGQRLPASAVVSTVDPWQLVDELAPATSRSGRRARRRWRPAGSPTVTHHRSSPGDRDDADDWAHLTGGEHPFGSDQTTGTAGPGPADVQETVLLDRLGVPTVSYRRPTVDGGALVSTHDHTRAEPRRSAGIAWHGFRSWLDRPPVAGEPSGLFLAGPFSRGGSSAPSVVLSAALAAYACSDHLG